MIAQQQTGVLKLGTELAAAGRYAAALGILDAAPADDSTLEMKALRAKILSQQGDFAQAVEAWREVVDGAPDDPEARRALELAKRLHERGCRSASPRRGVLVAAGLLLAVVLGICLAYAVGRNAGIAAVVAQDTVQKAQAARLDTANGLVDSLQSMVAHDKKKEDSAAQAVAASLAALDRQVADLEQTVGAAAPLQEDFAAKLDSARESLEARLDESCREARAGEAKMETRLADIEGQLAEQLAQVQETSEQTRAAVEHAEPRSEADEELSKALGALRRDLGPALSLARAVRSLRDSYERIALRRGYVSRQEHAQMRSELSRLCDQCDLLLEQTARQALAR